MGFKKLASYDVRKLSLPNPAKRGTDDALMVDQDGSHPERYNFWMERSAISMQHSA
jgi:hypothetical protein